MGTIPGQLPTWEEPQQRQKMFTSEAQVGGPYTPVPTARPVPAPRSSNLGMTVMIICVVGLVLCFALPWLTINTDDDDYDAWYDRSFEKIDSQSGDYASKKYLRGDTKDYYSWGLAFVGLLLGIIFGAIIMILGRLSAVPKLVGIVTRLICGVVLLFSTILLTYAAARPIGGFLINANLNADETSYLTPVPLILLILGLVSFVISLLIVRAEKNNLLGLYVGMRSPAGTGMGVYGRGYP